MKTNMHFGASPLIFERARYLRKHPTPVEEILWKHLRKHQILYKFRRQHPLSKYVVDFYCHANRFAIELDGSIHNDKEQQLIDQEKETELRDLGIYILRIMNREVFEDIDDVVSKIYSRIKGVEIMRFKKNPTSLFQK